MRQRACPEVRAASLEASLEASAARAPGRVPAQTLGSASRPAVDGLALVSALAARHARDLLFALAACGGDDVKAGDLHGSVVDPPFTVSKDALVDTDGEPYSLADSTDKRLTLVFFGYTNCPDICGTVMGNLASAMTRLDDERPRPGRRGVRDHRPRARHRRRAPRATSTATTRASSASPARSTRSPRSGSRSRSAWGRSCPPAATRSTRTPPRSPASTATTRRRSTGARRTSSAQFAQDIHTLLGDT